MLIFTIMHDILFWIVKGILDKYNIIPQTFSEKVEILYH